MTQFFSYLQIRAASYCEGGDGDFYSEKSFIDLFFFNGQRLVIFFFTKCKKIIVYIREKCYICELYSKVKLTKIDSLTKLEKDEKNYLTY